MPFYTESAEVMFMKDPLFDLSIGNIPGAREPNDANPNWGLVAAAVIRAQARERGNPKPLKVKAKATKVAVDKELVRLQEKESTLQKFEDAKGTETRKRKQDFL